MKTIALGLSGAILALILLASPAQAAGVTYTVAAGDTLWNISRQYHVAVDTIKNLNGLNDDSLQIGQVLVIIPEETVAPEPVIAQQELQVIPPVYYTVQLGDSLYSIADAHNITARKLRALNGLSGDFLEAGQQLMVEAEKTVDLSDGTVVSSRGEARSPQAHDLLTFADGFIGTPYAYGGSGPGGFDCSGFTTYVFKQFGYSLSRSADGQYDNGTPVSSEELQPGDLVFFRCRSNIIDHVGIYVGDWQFIHSSSPRSGGVIYTSMDESYYDRSYAGAVRIISND
ncbi:MAG: LysM peptidoglycan-binding domain-containing protein [Syntrophomonadaceae bacterium]|nr:LysM peptidoglycan-binding domain-containing protein [Syntrophomonadaceae bacterium]